MRKFRNKYRIESARAQWHDYNGGAYFITICTAERNHYFGLIDDGVMLYNQLGKFVNDNLQNVSEHYPYAEIPVFQVMPNHVHAIVFIDEPVAGVETLVDNNGAETVGNDMDRADSVCVDCRDAARHVSTSNATTTPPSNVPTNATVTGKNEKMHDMAVNRGRLSTVVGGLKSATTKYANDNKIPFGWQERFHDHIIRDMDELNRIAIYIENNPKNWKEDTFYNEEK